jgi:hypothetical protein
LCRGAGHPQTLFLFKDEGGRRRCKLIRRNDEAYWRQAGKNYRQFREDLKRLIRKTGQLGAGRAVSIARQVAEGLVGEYPAHLGVSWTEPSTG